jgi:response regulator RpfG family c-di-GMP phosphodiesterase
MFLLGELTSSQMLESAQRLNAIVDDFEAALGTLSEILQHIEEVKPNNRLRVVMLNNTIVALTATIEEALRGLFQEYLSILEESFEDHRRLRQALQKANLDCAIQDLRKYKNGGDFKTAAIVVSNLEKCLTGQSGYQLLKEHLAFNQRNFKSQQVTEISKNVGISSLWERICDCREIEDFAGETIVAARVTRLTSEWNKIFEERDLVVHRISQANGWASELIQQSIDLSKLVVKRIATCLSDDADELRRADVRGV